MFKNKLIKQKNLHNLKIITRIWVNINLINLHIKITIKINLKAKIAKSLNRQETIYGRKMFNNINSKKI